MSVQTMPISIHYRRLVFVKRRTRFILCLDHLVFVQVALRLPDLAQLVSALLHLLCLFSLPILPGTLKWYAMADVVRQTSDRSEQYRLSFRNHHI